MAEQRPEVVRRAAALPEKLREFASKGLVGPRQIAVREEAVDELARAENHQLSGNALEGGENGRVAPALRDPRGVARKLHRQCRYRPSRWTLLHAALPPWRETLASPSPQADTRPNRVYLLLICRQITALLSRRQASSMAAVVVP